MSSIDSTTAEDDATRAAAALDHASHLQAIARAELNPDHIMLSLRADPVFPRDLSAAAGVDSSANTKGVDPSTKPNLTPEAAFIVSGGPTCLMREILLPPRRSHNPSVPQQIYAVLEAVRRAHNQNEFYPAARAMRAVMLVWKKKHVWSLLRQHPDWTLTRVLEEDDAVIAERKEMQRRKEVRRKRKEKEEADALAKLAAEQGEEDAKQQQQQQDGSQADGDENKDDEDGDDQDDGDEEDQNEDDPTSPSARSPQDTNRSIGSHRSNAHAAQSSTSSKKPQTSSHKTIPHINSTSSVHTSESPSVADSYRRDGHGQQQQQQQQDPEETITFPSVSSEDELEFLTYFYNTLGMIYQSSASAPENVVVSKVLNEKEFSAVSAVGGSTTRTQTTYAKGIDWSSFPVLPCNETISDIKFMLRGTRGRVVQGSDDYEKLEKEVKEVLNWKSQWRKKDQGDAEAIHEGSKAEDNGEDGEEESDEVSSESIHSLYSSKVSHSPDPTFAATTTTSTSSSSTSSCDSRALISYWYARRCHDMYVQIQDEEVRKKEQARISLIKESGGKNGNAVGGAVSTSTSAQTTSRSGVENNSLENDMASDADSINGSSTGGSGGGMYHRSSSSSSSSTPLNTHTTLSYPALFSSVPQLNTPGLTVQQLLPEVRQLGLLVFQTMNGKMRDGGNSSSGGSGSSTKNNSSTITSSDHLLHQIFWATQPILAQHANSGMMSTLSLSGGGTNGSPSASGAGGNTKGTDSARSLTSATSSSPSGGQPSSSTASHSLIRHHTTAGQRLHNPYSHSTPLSAITYSNLGSILYHQGNFSLSLRMFHISFQLRILHTQKDDDEYSDVIINLNNIGCVLTGMALYEQAREYFKAGLEVAEKRFDSIHPRLTILQTNLIKIQSRRFGAILSEPEIMKELKENIDAKEKKEQEVKEKMKGKNGGVGANANAAAGGKKNSTITAVKNNGMSSPTTSKSDTQRKTPSSASNGGKKPLGDNDKPKDQYEDPRYFQAVPAGAPPIIPSSVEGAPLGTTSSNVKIMPLRNWDVEMGQYQKLLLEFGPPKSKKAVKGEGKKKK